MYRMQSFLAIASALLFLHSCFIVNAESAGSLRPGTVGKTGPSKIFTYRKYEDFQISHGTAGHSLENAQKVFVDPFKGINLKEITQTDVDNLVTMSREAVENEKGFHDAQKKTGGSKKGGNKELAAGLIANKVLKLVGEIQALELQHTLNLDQIDFEGSLAEHRTKLAKNTKKDRLFAGRKMISFLSLGKSGAKAAEEK